MSSCRLHPPALSADDEATAEEENLPWVLLELKAYVAKRDNATTAASTTWDGKRVQVTICPRRPPRVSYLCVHSPDAAEIHMEPRILAVEDGLALLMIAVGPQKDVDYYVYQAGGGSLRPPSLTCLPRTPTPRPYFFSDSNIGVLRHRADDDGDHARREYIVAGLYAPWDRPAGQYDLCLYDSKRGDWKVHGVSLSNEQRRRHGGRNFFHKCCKVIAIGGDAGTVAFVDLWRGILFCDVLAVEAEAAARRERGANPMPLLRYVTVPVPNKEVEADARVYRDIAVVGGRLKYVELRLYRLSGGWMASTWSRPAIITGSSSSDEDCCWRQDTEIMDCRNVKVHAELVVPKAWRDAGMARSPFRNLVACQPVLGLQEDADIIYFTTRIGRYDADAWVVSVDMRKKELIGVAGFDAKRYIGIGFSHVHARLSKQMLAQS